MDLAVIWEVTETQATEMQQLKCPDILFFFSHGNLEQQIHIFRHPDAWIEQRLKFRGLRKETLGWWPCDGQEVCKLCRLYTVESRQNKVSVKFWQSFTMMSRTRFCSRPKGEKLTPSISPRPRSIWQPGSLNCVFSLVIGSQNWPANETKTEFSDPGCLGCKIERDPRLYNWIHSLWRCSIWVIWQPWAAMGWWN